MIPLPSAGRTFLGLLCVLLLPASSLVPEGSFTSPEGRDRSPPPRDELGSGWT